MSISGPVSIGGFEEREFEGDSPAEEVAAQIRTHRADPVQLRAQEIDKPRKCGLSCSVIHSACTKLSSSAFGTRKAQQHSFIVVTYCCHDFPRHERRCFINRFTFKRPFESVLANWVKSGD
jgi:hypothetical protein